MGIKITCDNCGKEIGNETHPSRKNIISLVEYNYLCNDCVERYVIWMKSHPDFNESFDLSFENIFKLMMKEGREYVSRIRR